MQATTQGAPAPITDGAGLRGAYLRRDELSGQLRSLSDLTGQLTRERADASATNSTEQVRTLTSRISELSARTQRIQNEKLQTDDLIADALARGVTTGEEAVPGGPSFTVPSIMIPPFPEVPPSIRNDRSEERAAAVVGGLLGLTLLAMAIWRLGKRSAMKKMGRVPAAADQEGVKELRHAVEAIAVEVERISEGQRFVTALLSEKAQKDQAALERVNRER